MSYRRFWKNWRDGFKNLRFVAVIVALCAFITFCAQPHSVGRAALWFAGLLAFWFVGFPAVFGTIFIWMERGEKE